MAKDDGEEAQKSTFNLEMACGESFLVFILAPGSIAWLMAGYYCEGVGGAAFVASLIGLYLFCLIASLALRCLCEWAIGRLKRRK